MSQAVVQRILKRAGSLDQIRAGVCPLNGLLSSASYRIYRTLGWDEDDDSGTRVEPEFPAQARSVLVLALSHPVKQASLDWWERGNTEGNRRLIQAIDELKDWLADEMGLWSEPLPYYPEKGGLFLKETAALAGVGVIGRNNLFLTPTYGARVRLRALLLDVEAPEAVPPQGFDPCADCLAPCLEACPQGALSQDGYSRDRCLVQMNLDRRAAGLGQPGAVSGPVKYCRRCEHACVANRIRKPRTGFKNDS